MKSCEILYAATAAALICTLFQVALSNPVHAHSGTNPDSDPPIVAGFPEEETLPDTAMTRQWIVVGPGVEVMNPAPMEF
jgi:hypothetical protein